MLTTITKVIVLFCNDIFYMVIIIAVRLMIATRVYVVMIYYDNDGYEIDSVHNMHGKNNNDRL